MTSLRCFPSAPSIATAKSSGDSASNSNSNTTTPSANLLPSTAAAPTVAPTALYTSALATASSGGGADYDPISPSSLFGPWVELGATPTNSLNPFFDPRPSSTSHPHHPPSSDPPYCPSHPTHDLHNPPSANSRSSTGSGAKHPPTPRSLPPSHKILQSSSLNSEGNTKPNKRPASSVVSPSSPLRPSPAIRLSERETLSKSGGGGGTGSLKRETPIEGDAGDHTMSVHSQGNSHDDKPSSRIATSAFFPEIPRILPHEKVFPIQIGGELFRLSGASISSDAPSYFSQFFEQQLANLEEGQSVRTLYIDRDPVTFRDIARHLQVPKLISQLFESEIFISIGSRPFQINRELFQSPGNNPNYFSLGFAVFFSSPNEVFPGLSREGLLRPPSILPPEVPTRSGEVFAELLHLLRGYPVHIRNEEHRQELLRDCKYFHLKGLEQKLIPHEISWNQKRQKQEIVIRLEDIKPSGISFAPDPINPDQMPPRATSGWITYSRPFVDETQRELILEIGGEQTKVDWRLGRAEFSGTTNQRVTALLQVIANKLGLPVGHERALGLVLMQNSMNGSASGSTPGPASPGNTPLSEDRVKIKTGPDCFVQLDGEEWQGWDREGVNSVDGHDLDGTAVDDAYGMGSRPGPGSDAGRSAAGGSPNLPWQQHSGTGSRPPSTKPQGAFLGMHPRKRQKRMAGAEDSSEWLVKRGQWRLRVQMAPGVDGRDRPEVILVGVKLDAFSGEYGRNEQRKFLI
ncbi:hypothetical protein HOY80DRAFT_182940 [Tuber brumale]|nr:hypothetical protein HOY80DRAFT_182940 [Tuber brumale]